MPLTPAQGQVRQDGKAGEEIYKEAGHARRGLTMTCLRHLAGASSSKFGRTSKMSSRKVGDITQKDTRGLTEKALMPPSVPLRVHVALLCRNRSQITFALRGLMSPFGKSSANLAITSSASSSIVSSARSWTGSK